METQEIKEKAKSMKSVQDLAELLNTIKLDEFGTSKYKITEKQLFHFSSVNFPNRYKLFHIRKKSGGLREIHAPCYQLSILLYLINKVLKSLYIPKSCVTGFSEGRSVVDNAKPHIGHNYVFNIDLKDFFPSIHQARIWKRLQVPPFKFNQPIANLLAGLCCMKETCEDDNGYKKSVFVLPQGAPTSPIITNMICDKLDYYLSRLAKRFNMNYTRYADDITFSSMRYVYSK
jgi:retron-type reverse transcriptase